MAMTRSEIMSRIKSKGNKSTELAMVKLFRRYRLIGWRRQQRVCGINVDFVFPKRRRVVFVDGCFWHKCPIHFKVPKKRKQFWYNKVSSNAARDRYQTAHLMNNGWQVMRVWEHELKETSR